MRAQVLLPVGAGAALVGLVLLALGVARTVGSNTLGTTGTVLLWVGLGLFALGAAVLATVATRPGSDG